MKGDRDNKQHAAEYMEGFYTIRQCMASGRWFLVDGSIILDQDFSTLHEAREWCKAHPADPDFEGKYA